MLENSTEPSSIANTTTVKRYAPPNQRNRSLGRKKSGVERSNEVGEKNTRYNIPSMNNGDATGYNSNHQLIISLSGCSNSEAYHLLNDRWNAAIHSYNDTSIDLSERPVMYCSNVGPAALPQFRLPHQAAPPSQMDFLTELRRAMQHNNANSTSSHRTF
ncbi:uncharacterized protein LOC124915630 [Impatiens glandulifera]|uniref:uncharacterized protein LOC124915630 n=1 Tax=Impatiens glandulifera TaxID=253017 RepID=UPI001FB151D4|nr:uncharacterized protein LOC124915630 [Impatiens glandulifera]